MKQLVLNYTFSVSSKTITFTDFSFTSVDLKRLYLIVDVTTNKILYNFADNSIATATVSSNIVTLSGIASGSADSDTLQITYETLSTDPIYVSPSLPTNAAQETGGKLATIATNTGTVNAPQLLKDGLSTVLSTYMAANPTLKVQLAYQDDFNLGFQGWDWQYASTNPVNQGISLTTEARLGNYGLEMHTAAVGGAQSWGRKGYALPYNLKKVIFGCYFTLHSEDANSPGRVTFDCDTQFGDGTGLGNNRYYFSIRYTNWDVTSATRVQTWQVNSGNASSGQNYVDIPNGHMVIPFNEQSKPMPSYMMVVFDYTNLKYEVLYSNGQTFDLTSCTGPQASLSLTNPFDYGLVNIVKVENRSDSAKESNMIVERPFLAWVF